jgi:hypothetical protein
MKLIGKHVDYCLPRSEWCDFIDEIDAFGMKVSRDMKVKDYYIIVLSDGWEIFNKTYWNVVMDLWDSKGDFVGCEILDVWDPEK